MAGRGEADYSLLVSLVQGRSLSRVSRTSQGSTAHTGMYSACPLVPQLQFSAVQRSRAAAAHLKFHSRPTSWKFILYPGLPTLLIRRPP